ncbi:protein FAM177A1 isoform X2 [Alligator sinensis]|uniref:Protein FAM177A1 isoform X2 n=1 Tax=Alligator sinensis TaxID=38654 RepID=A0A3Q0GD48_ALLSI|nr:protein FAM177A1 isoform X2 [Alligator sinensis]
MEEYSTDEEEDEQEKKDLLPPIDPRQYCKVRLPDVSAVLLPVKLAVAMLSVLKLSFLITSGCIVFESLRKIWKILLFKLKDQVRWKEKQDFNPNTTLTWGPYLWFQMLRVATSTLSVCDFLGEKIASVLGISTPKYQYAIDEYYRMKKEPKDVFRS